MKKGNIVKRKTKHSLYKGITGTILKIGNRYGNDVAQVKWSRSTGTMAKKTLTNWIKISSLILVK